MPNGDLNGIAQFVLGIADDVPRDVCVGGKYRDVILPICQRVQEKRDVRKGQPAHRHPSVHRA